MSTKKAIPKKRAAEKVTPPAEPITHKIDGKAVASALHKARVPARFVRPEVTLDAFPWGFRLRDWIRTMIPEALDAGKSLAVSGKSEDSMAVSAMIARTLVLRGHDAVLMTLEELMSAEEQPRPCGFLVIAGFYDGAFDKVRGCPLTPAESFKLSWMLWRMANDGTTLIVYCSPAFSGMDKWWHVGALRSLFDNSQSLHITA
jgi:hypothetical protein